MKILVSGGCGFVGSNISLYLKKKNKSYIIETLDNFERLGSKINFKRLNNHGIKNHNINIIDLKKFLKLPKYDLIIDCCAETSVEESKKDTDKIFNVNLIGTYNILKKCKKDNSNILFFSSSRVYSIESLNSLIKNKLNKNINYRPKVNEYFDDKGPKSFYGFTKVASELLIKEFAYLYKFKYIINRLGVISGPWQFGKQDQGFVVLWLWRHIIKKNLSYIGYDGKGHQMRDIIHINDVCNLVDEQIKKIKKINNKLFNVGGGPKNTISLKELTKKSENITGNRLKIKKTKKTSKYDIFYYATDNSKIYKVYNWRINYNVDQILLDTYLWLINNFKILTKILK